MDIISFIRKFLWTIILLGFALGAQILVSLETIEGYPENMWRDYFLRWWVCSLPFLLLGIWLVLKSPPFKVTISRSLSILGRIILFLVVLAHYFSLLAVG